MKKALYIFKKTTTGIRDLVNNFNFIVKINLSLTVNGT